MKENKIKFAVIGAGHIGKRHAEMISRNKESELVAFCDVKREEDLNISHFNVPLYNSVEHLLDNHLDVDVVVHVLERFVQLVYSILGMEVR